MEQVELDVPITGAVEQHLVVQPIVGIDARDIAHAVGVLKLGGLRCDKEVERIAACGRIIRPIRLDRIPERAQTLDIGVAVLDHKCGDTLGVFEGKPIPDGRSVVHHVHGVSLRSQLLHERVNDVGIVPERVGKLRMIRRPAVAEARIVRRNHAVPVSQDRDQVTEHVRRGGKAVQEEHHGRVGGAGLPIEHVNSLYRRVSIMRDDRRGLADCRIDGGRRRCMRGGREHGRHQYTGSGKAAQSISKNSDVGDHCLVSCWVFDGSKPGVRRPGKRGG